jgi:O-antigen/teichoic acid export membrane protein
MPGGDARRDEDSSLRVHTPFMARLIGVDYPSGVARGQAVLRRAQLPRGAWVIGLGCLVSGIAAYAFLAATARVLGPVGFTPLSELWTLALLLAPGTFVAVEQEVTRAVAARDASGEGYDSVVRTTGAMGVVLCLAWMAVVLACSPFLMGRIFDHQALLVVGLAAALPSYLALHLTCGALAGSQRFKRYALLYGGEGVTRLILCVVLIAFGVRSPGPYGVVIGAAPLFLVLLLGRVDRGPKGPNHAWQAASRALGRLLGGSLFNQILLMVPPIFVALFATAAERTRAGTFVAAMVLVRVPLFLFNAVLASLLAQLSRQAADGHRLEFRQTRTRLLKLVAVAGAATTVGVAAFGPALLPMLFGSSFHLGRADVALLGGACAAYMVALILGQALIAQRQHFRTTIAWGVGLATFGLVLVVRANVLVRVESAFLAGCLAAAAVMALETVRHEQRPGSVFGRDRRSIEPAGVGTARMASRVPVPVDGRR